MRKSDITTGNIIVVGPILPFRGGISQYNGLLFKSLKNLGLSTLGVSFSRQYPAILYPGKSDKEEGAGDEKVAGILYSLDSLNPLSWWKTTRRIASERPALVVFHWWTIFWAPCFTVLCYLLKRKQIRVAFICHNLEDHDSGRLKSWISRRVLDLADGFLTHSNAQRMTLESRFPDRPIMFHPIPKYGHYPKPSGALSKRGRLELLFFGFIRPYKGLDLLIEALGQLKDDDVYLTVVGEPWGDMQDLREWVDKHRLNVEFHLEYKPDEEVAEYFNRADFIVLPYRHATGSAVASVAHQYNKPLLASHVGGLPDVVEHGRTGMLFPPGDVIALAQVIAAVDRKQADAFSAQVEEYGKRWSWDSLACTLQQLAQRMQAAGKDSAHV